VCGWVVRVVDIRNKEKGRRWGLVEGCLSGEALVVRERKEG